MNKNLLDVVRIGIFYDGQHFFKVSNYYKYEHERKLRINISGFQEFIRNEIAKLYKIDVKQFQRIEAHYFKGRPSARDIGDRVQSERVFEDILMRENIVTHYLPLLYDTYPNSYKEKGIDVWLALEAYELAIYKHFDILVLVAADGDYVPLVRKLHTLGTQVILPYWNFSYHNDNGDPVETKTSWQLLEEVFSSIFMTNVIDKNEEDCTKNIFVQDKSLYYNEEKFLPFANLNNNTTNGNSTCTTNTQPTPTPPPRNSKVLEVLPLEEREYESTIFTISPNGFGFIRDEKRGNIFFHYSTVVNRDFSELKYGMKVKYKIMEDAERTKRDEEIRYKATRVVVLDE
jgi:uncharacterized LabA/DUF88 family protein/cold shock CspA family protein